LHDKEAESNKVEEEGPAPSTKVDWSATRTDTDFPDAQMETPTPPNTGAQSATLDGTDDVTDTAECTTEAEPCQQMEMSEPQIVFLTGHDGEYSTLTIKSRGHSPIRHQEEAGASGVGGFVAIAEKDDTPPHRDRDRTPEENRRSPKRNKS
jgi:hypothetical protein